MNNSLLTRDEYLQSLENRPKPEFVQWSEPKYLCPTCQLGGVRKHLYHSMTLTCLPPVTKHLYQCDRHPECNYSEYLAD